MGPIRSATFGYSMSRYIGSLMWLWFVGGLAAVSSFVASDSPDKFDEFVGDEFVVGYNTIIF
jgi:hypothetical protein